MQRDTRGLWGKRLRWIAGLSVAGLSLWILIRDVEWPAVGQALETANYRWVVVGLVAIVGTFFTRTMRWRLLLWQFDVPLRPAMTALLNGQVLNMVLPMRSGDVLRATWIGARREVGTMEALGSVAIEKVWDLLALLVCGLILLAVIPLPDWFAQSTWGTGLILVLGGGLLWALLRWQKPLFRWLGDLLSHLPVGWDQALVPRLQRLTNGLESVRKMDVSAQVMGWTALNWALGAVANLAVLWAFGIPSAIAALFLLAALMVAGKVPTPAQLGVFEGTCVLALTGLFDVARDQALAVGLVLHVVVLGPPLLGAALLSLLNGYQRSARECS